MGIIDSLLSALSVVDEIVPEQRVEQIKRATINAFKDTVECIVSGRRTLDEWAQLLAPSVDDVVDAICKEGMLAFAGGKLKFYFKDSSRRKVIIAYELYFIDRDGKWEKAEAKSDVFADMFTDQCLNDLRTIGEIAYEVTK